MATTRNAFSIPITGINKVMLAFGIRPSTCRAEITTEEVRVRMGWGFSLVAPLSSVRHVATDDRRVISAGAHGWRGRWLVNGSSQGVVRIDFAPPARATTLWVLRPRIHELRVAVDDPEGLIDALRRAAAAGG